MDVKALANSDFNLFFRSPSPLRPLLIPFRALNALSAAFINPIDYDKMIIEREERLEMVVDACPGRHN